MKKPFKYIDLFAGIGGFHYGLMQCGGICVMASEIDEKTAKTYYENYKINPLGDICKIDSKTIPDFDLLCAGFPCQSFSNIGNKKGLDDDRGNLIFQVIRILKERQPKAFLLENVKGLLSHNNNSTFKFIKIELEKCGYKVYYKVLEAKDFGVPQLRKRLFIVGIRADIDVNFEFPNEEKQSKKLSDIMRGKTEREYAFTVRIGGRYSGINSKYNWDCYKVDGIERYITLEECLELQGFPRDFYLNGNKSHKFKQIGNAVPTVIIKAIGKQLCKYNIF